MKTSRDTIEFSTDAFKGLKAKYIAVELERPVNHVKVSVENEEYSIYPKQYCCEEWSAVPNSDLNHLNHCKINGIKIGPPTLEDYRREYGKFTYCYMYINAIDNTGRQITRTIKWRVDVGSCGIGNDIQFLVTRLGEACIWKSIHLFGINHASQK